MVIDSQRLRDIHAEAVREFDEVWSVSREERLQCLEDRRFYSIVGAQWEGKLGQQFENKPKFEVNKIHLAVLRIINEYRNNRISVNFVSKNGETSDDLADVCNGLYRADEEDSAADEAYDNCFEEGTAGGFGAIRFHSEYEDEEDPDDEKQRVRISPIFDADTSVFFDLQAKRQDKRDAKKCWLLTSMTRSSFEETYNEDPDSWPKEVNELSFDWATPDVVFVAEYFVIEEKKETIHFFKHLDGSEEKYTDEDLEDNEILSRLDAVGATKDREKKINKRRCHKYIMSGSRVLEDCGYTAGPNIPIVPFYGKRWFVDNIERCMGHVRLAKDPQRLGNMLRSKLGEISALSTVEKPIVTPEQISGNEHMWETDNVKDYAYLLINPITDQNGNEQALGPVGYTKPSSIPPALAALMSISDMDINELLGSQQNGERLEGNISTETAHLVQNKLDMQTFIYMSNLAKTMKRGAEVWLGMSRDILIEKGRKMKTIGSQGEIDSIELLSPSMDSKGAEYLANDLSKANFDVVAEVGPSSSTKRSATVRSLNAMMQSTDDPETRQVLTAMAMMNMEGEGVSDVRGFFRNKLIKMGVVKPTKQEAQDLAEEQANTPPSANDEFLRASAEAEKARGAKAQSDAILNQAKTDKTRADTAKVMSDIDIDQGQQALEVIEKVGPRVTPPDLTYSKIEGD